MEPDPQRRRVDALAPYDHTDLVSGKEPEAASSTSGVATRAYDLGFDELAKSICARACPHRARIVAIDGAAGSGKSTFAARLAPHLAGAPIVPMDDFLAWDDLTEYVPRFEAQVLAPLLAGRDLRYQRRDWIHDMMGRGLGEFRDVPFRDIVIFEGIGAAQRALGPSLTYSIWITAPAELRLERGLARDGHIDGMRAVWEGFMPGEKTFFEREQTSERADLVVDGSVPYNGDPPRFRVLRQALAAGAGELGRSDIDGRRGT